MNRRQKIIVSVTGIFIVLLVLLGLTYAYFLTRITGNSNPTSISVTTAKLELVYGDNSAEIIKGTGALMPIVETDADDAIGTKTFTVTNNGNDSSYVVIIDNVSVTKVSDGSATTFVSNDFRYTLSCKKSDNTDCNNVSDLTIFPIKGGILVSNDIEEDDVHTYTLTLWYIDTGVDQSDDMGKIYQARVNIADVAQMENPFTTGVTATDNASLAYNIINNAKENKNGTKLLNTPLTNVAAQISEYAMGYEDGEQEMPIPISEISGIAQSATILFSNNANKACTGTSSSSYKDTVGKYMCITLDTEQMIFYIKSFDEETDSLLLLAQIPITESENTLSLTTDDYGTSYYYRGNVSDNYVTFADMCWRIVRIAGDGSIKLILEDQDQPCSTSINGNWAIPTTTGGTTYTGNFGYTQHSSNTLTASDGTKNSYTRYLMDYLHGQTNSDKSMATAFKNFQSTFTETELSKLKAGNWCLGDNAYNSSNNILNSTQIMDNKIKGTSFYYDAYTRLTSGNANGYQPTLKCNGTIMNYWDDNETNPTPMYVGAITADEVAYAGGKVDTSNQNYYLINEEFKKGEYGANKSYYFWSLSPSDFDDDYDDRAFRVYDLGRLDYYGDVHCDIAFRPSVSLASSAVISEGEGTLEKPYKIG